MRDTCAELFTCGHPFPLVDACSGAEAEMDVAALQINAIQAAQGEASKTVANSEKIDGHAVEEAEKDQQIEDEVEERKFLASGAVDAALMKAAKDRVEEELVATKREVVATKRELVATQRELGIAYRDAHRDQIKLNVYEKRVRDLNGHIFLGRASQIEGHRLSMENSVSALTARADAALDETANLNELVKLFMAHDTTERVELEEGAGEAGDRDIDNSEVQVGCMENFLSFLR